MDRGGPKIRHRGGGPGQSSISNGGRGDGTLARASRSWNATDAQNPARDDRLPIDNGPFQIVGRGRGQGQGTNGPGGRWLRGRGGEADGNQRETRPLGFQKLQILSETEIDKLLEALTMDGSFYALINMETKPSWDYRRLILVVLARASRFNVAYFRINVHTLLRRVVDSAFLQKWLPEDVISMRCRVEQFSNSTQEERERFIEHVGTLLAEILDKLPDSAMRFSQLATSTLDSLKDPTVFQIQTDDEDEPMFRRVQKRLQILWDDIVQAKQRQPENPEQHRGPRERDPLEDFRQLPILPRQDEILTDQKPRLRRNKKKGAYDSVDHYLDILFRLLREDFVWPIRDAINAITEQQQPELLQQAGQRRPKQYVHIYDNAVIKEPEFDQKSAMMVYEVRFDMSRFNRVNWETTKRLMQGSLLCFTPDGFQTVFFATTYDRDPRKLSKGIVKVTMDTFPVGGLNLRQRHSFVESPSFFEAYKHVLKALQAIRGPQDMPFPQQLVFCNPEVQPPAYIDANPMVDFTCMLKDNEHGRRLLVKDVRRSADWPSKERLGLDESQQDAVRQALTKRLAIIQGPPGTGKTYVGLKITQLLLHKMAEVKEMGPILVVCYTNHALDQFLDGIAEFMPERDQNLIVRIGGAARMKESVQKFHVKNFTWKRRNPNAIQQRLWDVKDERRSVEGNIERMKQLAIIRQRWFLTKDQIRRISGAQVNTLFDVKTQYPQIMKNDEDVMNTWLYQLGSLDAPPASTWEAEAVYRLANFTGFHPHICFKALRASYPQGESEAIEWLNMVYELKDCGYPESEAVFALELNGGNVDAAAKWLEWLGSPECRNGGTAAKSAPTPAVTENGMRASPQPEQLEFADEILAPERDYNGFDTAFREEDDQPRLRGQFARERNLAENEVWTENEFTKKGTPPKLPPFIQTCIGKSTPMTPQEAERAILDLWGLPVPQRWRLYRFWQQRWYELAEEEQRRLEEQYQVFTEEIQECNDLCLVHHLRSAKVIAMTTTGAAKNQAVLSKVQPKVVIIEEAAEVLEAHIVTSLSTGCQHLILIGDHKQLRPNPSVYQLAKNFDLDISLFERLINNGFQHAQLKNQHRMRPEISDTLMPRFYEDGLLNHESVYGRENVRGMGKNMYFIDHRHLEAGDGDSASHKNVHEARYLVALCKYLIQQGYEADKITILCCYLAQMFEIKRLVGNEFSEEHRVRVAVVDNFQGEENGIILLSMVRSNREGRVGFLNTDNRVCVALSRARDGFYVIGNFEHLAKNSKLWEDLVDRMKAADCLGPALDIRCQIHDESRMITTPKDFFKEAPEGGCKEMCDMRMPCGHVCNRRCHPTDPKHEKTRCKRECEKRCPEGHKCSKFCFQDCGNCTEHVEKVLDCGHEVTIECYKPEETVFCMEPCPNILPGCGHQCHQRCGDICSATMCFVNMEKFLPCGHRANIACNQDPSTYGCMVDVEKTLVCGHVATIPCSQLLAEYACIIKIEKSLPCGHVVEMECGHDPTTYGCVVDVERTLACGHLETVPCNQSLMENTCFIEMEKHLPCGHVAKMACGNDPSKYRCVVIVEKALSCDHVANLPCNQNPADYKCIIKMEKPLSCGHVVKMACCQDPIGYKCNVKVKKPMPFCGHVNEVNCSTDVNSVECRQPCGKILKCGDRCSGTCSQCRRGRLHKKCEKDCKRIFICGHERKEKCSKACPPCRNPCENRCIHSKCGRPQKRPKGPTSKPRTCGEPCPPCVKPCAWKCDHHECKQRCFEPCTRPRCVKKCPKKLKCGHNCIGACGDTCPKLCRECDKDDYENLLRRQGEFMPIDEDAKDDIIFVELDDCQHRFEMNFLDQWFDAKVAEMKENGKVKIQLLQCLVCQTPVRNTPRYGAMAKQALQDVQRVKVKQQGNLFQLDNKRRVLGEHLAGVSKKLSGSALKASMVVLDLVERTEQQHLDRNRVANWENFIRVMDQMIAFQREDMRELKGIVYRLDETDRKRSIAKRGPRGAVATRFMEQFYGKKNPTTDGLWESEALLGIIEELNFLFDWISTNAKSCSQQMVEEFGYEWRRMVIFAQLIEVLIKATDKGKEMDNEEWAPVEEVMKLINGEEAFIEDIEKRAKVMIDALVKICGVDSGLGITEKKKVEIIQAMDLTCGHWFKCPCGHVFCVGQFGGVMEESKCPECTGGMGGSLEIDGATRNADGHEFYILMQEDYKKAIFDK